MTSNNNDDLQLQGLMGHLGSLYQPSANGATVMATGLQPPTAVGSLPSVASMQLQLQQQQRQSQMLYLLQHQQQQQQQQLQHYQLDGLLPPSAASVAALMAARYNNNPYSFLSTGGLVAPTTSIEDVLALLHRQQAAAGSSCMQESDLSWTASDEKANTIRSHLERGAVVGVTASHLDGDCSSHNNDEEEQNTDTFPHKLYRMILYAEREGLDHVLSFLPDGKCFAVHKPREFVANVMPLYFSTTRLSSFQRQLNLYGFTRISEGVNRGCFRHKHFIKGRPELCKNITRRKAMSSKAVVAAPLPPTPRALPAPAVGMLPGRATSTTVTPTTTAATAKASNHNSMSILADLAAMRAQQDTKGQQRPPPPEGGDCAAAAPMPMADSSNPTVAATVSQQRDTLLQAYLQKQRLRNVQR